MKKIISSGKEYYYKELDFYQGMKKIDCEISKTNLLDFKKILDKKELSFGIIYGTLLGAVREKGFIPHDQDTDLFMLKEDKTKFIDILFELRENGFELARDENDLMSIVRDGEYIDVYFFRKKFFIYRKVGRQYILKEHLEKKEYIDFFNESFRVPYKHIVFLEKHYGKDWKIPVENKPAKSLYFIGKYKEFIKDILKLNS